MAQVEVEAALGKVVSLAGYRDLLRFTAPEDRGGESPLHLSITAPPKTHKPSQSLSFSGAGYRVRTYDIQLGKTKKAVTGRFEGT